MPDPPSEAAFAGNSHILWRCNTVQRAILMATADVAGHVRTPGRRSRSGPQLAPAEREGDRAATTRRILGHL
eukprot:795626-Pyramimonas_sp.AAC.1